MFRLAKLSLRNRAVVALTTVAIVLGGFVAMTSLKLELIPSLQIPMAAVISTYPGATPQIIERELTEPVEGAILSVAGVESVDSTSMSSLAFTVVRFDYGTDMNYANQRLTTAMGRIAPTLPSEAETQVMTGSMDDFPVIQLAVAGQAEAATVQRSVEALLVPALEQIQAVRTVAVSGAAPEEITIALDTTALAAAGLGAAEVNSVLSDYGLSFPAGTVTQDQMTYPIQLGQPIETVEELAAIPLVATPTPVQLGDVAQVTQGPAQTTSVSRMNGDAAVAVAITKTPDGNVVDVSRAVQDVVSDLEEVLAERDLTVQVVFDQAPFIENSIAGLTEEGLLGLVFAVLVILVFLLSLRSTLVSAISIPLSLLTTFILMKAGGLTLNLLTLGAMTIAIGRVVDDSIVVVENIKRHLSYGEAKRDAIITAVREVGGAIAASTVCTVAVFAPIGFVGGMVGELFRPFGLTIAIALGASLLVSLTIVPVLAYWFVKSPVSVDQADLARQRAEAESRERRGLWQRAYLPTLRAALKHPVITLVTAVALLGGTVAMIPLMKTDFMGHMGQDTLTVTQSFEMGTSLEAQDAESKPVESALLGLDQVASVQTTIGGGGMMGVSLGAAPEAIFAVTLSEGADAAATPDLVRAALDGLGGQRTTGISVGGAEAMMGSTSIDIFVTAPDREALVVAAGSVTDSVGQLDGVVEVSNNLTQDSEAVQVTVNRAAAAAMGMTETQVMGLAAGLIHPSQIGTLRTEQAALPVRLALAPAPESLEAIAGLPLMAGPGGAVTLSDMAAVDIAPAPASLTRVNGERSATVAVTPRQGDLGQISGRVSAALDDLDFAPGVNVKVGGVAAQQSEAFADLGLALLLAIAIVFIVMVATFGSLIQPFILLVSIPFAATGALLALLATGTALGVPSLIGLLLLVGIVISNAIVLIDLINQYRRRGRELDQAIEEGARKRLRPIVMTAAATILALTPMALGVTGGGGSFISQPLAIVVIGGLVSSTMLTLVVVPVLYRFEARVHDRRDRRHSARLERRRAQRQAALDKTDSATTPATADPPTTT